MTLLDDTGLDTLTRREFDRRPVGLAPATAQPSGLWPRRRWLAVMALLIGWSFWKATAGRGRVVNAGGWTQVDRFASAAIRPELSGDFLKIVAKASATSAGYALVGTAMAMVIGVVFGVLSSRVWWARDPLDSRGGDHQVRRAHSVIRMVGVVPRGLHEAIWALIFVYFLGRNPLVAVFAIGIPFGAITAKVVAETIDDRSRASVEALRAAGAGRMSAMLYGVAPEVMGDVISYGFYRLECSIRSSVVLGAIGAGGLGFQLSLSFQSLRYREIWTLIYALVVLSAIADWWGASLRRRPTIRRRRVSIVIAAMLTVASVVALRLRPLTLIAPRARRLGADLATKAWPPRLPRGGWSKLFTAALDTLQLSVIAITVAVAVAVPLALLAARPERASTSARLLSLATRMVLLVARAIPPTVWALMILFVIFPGPLPGGLALGCYTAGVIGRMGAEIIENSDRAPNRALRAAGAPTIAAFAYGTVPTVAPRFTSLAMYRWEVAARETVIVGLVGAGGLGRLLAQQSAAFDEAAMLTTVGALVVVSLAIDLLSARLRDALR